MYWSPLTIRPFEANLYAPSTIDNEQNNNAQQGRYAQLMNRVEQLADKQHDMAILLNGTSSSDDKNVLTYKDSDLLLLYLLSL